MRGEFKDLLAEGLFKNKVVYVKKGESAARLVRIQECIDDPAKSRFADGSVVEVKDFYEIVGNRPAQDHAQDGCTASAAKGKVYLVGAGPGDPSLLTLRAAFLLANADVILHDDLVSEEIRSTIGSQAVLINVGKRCGNKDVTQEQIDALLIGMAKEQKCVVRLKSGDPLVFGRAGEEMNALRAADVSFEVVPGITSALAAAAIANISLTHRLHASKIVFCSGHLADASVGRHCLHHLSFGHLWRW